LIGKGTHREFIEPMRTSKWCVVTSKQFHLQ